MEMLCIECKDNLPSWIRGELSAAQASRIEQHIAVCKSCSIAAHNEKAILASLRASQAVPAPSYGFEERMLAVATDQSGRSPGRVSPHGWSTSMAGGAIAAALVVGIALGFGWNSDREPETDLATGVPQTGGEHSLVAEPVARNVRLAFSSREALDGVTLTVELPPHVEVASYPGHQKLSWKVDLDKGENVVNLPLNILFSGEGDLVAHLDDGRRTKTFRTSLDRAEGKAGQEPSS